MVSSELKTKHCVPAVIPFVCLFPQWPKHEQHHWASSVCVQKLPLSRGTVSTCPSFSLPNDVFALYNVDMRAGLEDMHLGNWVWIAKRQRHTRLSSDRKCSIRWGNESLTNHESNEDNYKRCSKTPIKKMRWACIKATVMWHPVWIFAFKGLSGWQQHVSGTVLSDIHLILVGVCYSSSL